MQADTEMYPSGIFVLKADTEMYPSGIFVLKADTEMYSSGIFVLQAETEMYSHAVVWELSDSFLTTSYVCLSLFCQHFNGNLKTYLYILSQTLTNSTRPPCHVIHYKGRVKIHWVTGQTGGEHFFRTKKKWG